LPTWSVYVRISYSAIRDSPSFRVRVTRSFLRDGPSGSLFF
jgi:hypothetical protein